MKSWKKRANNSADYAAYLERFPGLKQWSILMTAFAAQLDILAYIQDEFLQAEIGGDLPEKWYPWQNPRHEELIGFQTAWDFVKGQLNDDDTLW
jgi:hypothetical protein